MNVPVIDDDVSLRRSLRLAAETLEHRVTEADSGDAKQLLSHTVFDVAFLDLRLGTEHGLELLPDLSVAAPGLGCDRRHGLRDGGNGRRSDAPRAFDYVPLPFTPQQLRLVLNRSQRMHRLQTQLEDLEQQVARLCPKPI